MNTSRYGLPNNACFAHMVSSNSVKQITAFKENLLKKLPWCTYRLSNNEFQDSRF